nr:vhs domain-containing protein [Quercus suber]
MFKAYLHFTHGGSTLGSRTRYWRSRMIDGATSDKDKVTSVYKLEDICKLLRSSHASIVKEVLEISVRREILRSSHIWGLGWVVDL